MSTANHREIPLPLNIARRLESNSRENQATGCREYTRSDGSIFDGYAYMKIDGEPYLAHRVSYAAHNGEDPGQYVVRHMCHNPCCINPAHLALGDHAANKRDAIDHGTWAHGEGHGLAKLTDARVLLARREHRRGSMPIAQMAERFGVTRSALYQAIRGKTWKHLDDQQAPVAYVNQRSDTDAFFREAFGARVDALMEVRDPLAERLRRGDGDERGDR